MADVLVWPVRRGPDGTLATVREDTVDRVAQDIAIVLTTRPRERTWLPRFGTPSPLGQTAVDADVARRAIEEWVPDADLVELTAARSRTDPGRWAAQIRTARGRR